MFVPSASLLGVPVHPLLLWLPVACHRLSAGGTRQFSGPRHAVPWRLCGEHRSRSPSSLQRAHVQMSSMHAQVSEWSDPACNEQVVQKQASLIVPSVLMRLDSYTKWVVTFAQTAAVVIRRDMASPFMIIGAILASLLTAVLKRIVNQKRPSGAAFTDPGMPSSHAMVSTFLAMAWITHMPTVPLVWTTLAAAACVSILRVICKHHTWAQIAVGMVLGGVFGSAWMTLGAMTVLPCTGKVMYVTVYAIYVSGSVVFVKRSLRKGKIRSQN